MADNNVNISNVVNVQLFTQPTSAKALNVNVIGLFTDESAVGKVDNFTRATKYFSIADVASDFGTNSQTYNFAKAFFTQQPNPTSADGYLVIGHWRSIDFDAPATNGILTGGQLSEAIVVQTLQTITDGSFNVTIDGGTEQVITALDFNSISTLDDIVTILNSAISDAVVTISDQKIIITSDTTGITSIVTFLSAGASGTFIGDTLALATGTGAIKVDGVASSILSAETKLESVIAVQAVEDFISFGFIDNPIDADSIALSDYAQGQSSKLYYDVFDDTSNLEKVAGNPVWDIVLAGNKRTQMLYKPDGDRRSWLAYSSRSSVVKFNAQLTANTMANKELKTVLPDVIGEADLAKTKQTGLTVYTTVKDVPNLFLSGRNSYTDDEYNTIALVDALQTDSFNLLHLTNTKIPQTTKGLLQITDTIKKTLKRFVTNGVIAPGTWTLPDRFGDLNVFDKEIETIGFYVFPNPLSSQTTDERAERETPPIQIAVKFAGAFHSIDIILNINL